MSNKLPEIEELICMINGGEYRYHLPRRGITKKIVYRPIMEAMADAMIAAAEKINEWAVTIPLAKIELHKHHDYLGLR